MLAMTEIKQMYMELSNNLGAQLDRGTALLSLQATVSQANGSASLHDIASYANAFGIGYDVALADMKLARFCNWLPTDQQYVFMHSLRCTAFYSLLLKVRREFIALLTTPDLTKLLAADNAVLIALIDARSTAHATRIFNRFKKGASPCQAIA